MNLESIIIFFAVIAVALYIYKDDIKEHFTSLETVPVNDPILSEEQIESMDKTYDNSDTVDNFIYGTTSEQTGYDYINNKFSKGQTETPRTSHNLYDFSVNPSYLTRDDGMAANSVRRSRKNKDAILGNIRTGKDTAKRIFEEELQESERSQWYEDALQDIAVDSAKYFTPQWKLPSTKSGMRRTQKF